ncbi:ABC transporter ATP-binding protein [Thiolapillus sp.]
MPAPEIPLLQARNLRTAFIRDLALRLFAGEILGLHGDSGSGKTLLLRALADLDPNQGEVKLEGSPRESFSGPRWRRQVGLLPAESHWWEDQVGPHAEHWPMEVLAALGFSPQVLDWQTGRLSSGEKQRLALARLLANRPRVLLLDEPTANLDQGNTAAVEAIVRQYLKETGAAALWVSHDPAQLARLARRRAMMKEGRLTMEDG